MRKVVALIVVLGMVIILGVSTYALAGSVPDTGQTQSYTDTFGEDSDYTINPQSYTKLDKEGNELDDSAVSWSMVKDNVTGLIWEVKTDDGSIHDKDNWYTWDDAQSVFIAELNAANYGGFSDWRLPTVKELSSIVNSGTYGTTINTDYFPNTMSSYYWSSTTVVGNAYLAWCVYFGYGVVYGDDKSNSYCVRAVRGGQCGSLDNSVISSRLVINSDGTVTDTSTGLMWQQKTAGEMTWEAAMNYCENLSLGGYDDWRLPNRNELQSLVDYTRYDPAIDTAAFPDTMSSYYWSSTTFAYDTYYAWCVGFGDVHYGDKSGSYYVRAVRGGQSGVNDSGVLGIKETKGRIGNNIQVPVSIQNSSNSVYSFGFEVTYDASVLEYIGIERGDLTESFETVEAYLMDSGKLRIGGYTDEHNISHDASGNLVRLKFQIIGGQGNNCYPLQLDNLEDHIANFPKMGGCFYLWECNGDLNEDGEITPTDALIAFRCYLGSGDCPNFCSDADKNGKVTPLDALCIFQKYLGKPCCLD